MEGVRGVVKGDKLVEEKEKYEIDRKRSKKKKYELQ